MNDDETWVEGDHANTLNSFDAGDVRTTHAIVSDSYYVEDCENAALRANGANDGPPRTDKHPLVVETFPIDDGRDLEKHQNGTGIGAAGDPAYTIDRQQRPAVAQVSPTLTKYNLDSRSPQSEEQQRIVGAVHDATMSVRRLTPTECERLMGWPDEWTAPEGVKASDSKRYAACGDGIVAPVAFWIADRIRMIEGEA